MSEKTNPHASTPQQRPPNRPTTAAEQILATQREIMTMLQNLMSPPTADNPEGTTQQDPVVTMVDLLKEIAQALKIQRELLEIVIGFIRGAPGSMADLDAALRGAKK